MHLTIILLPLIAFFIAGLIALYVIKSNKSSFLNFIAWLASSFLIGVTALASFLLLLNMIKKEESLSITMFNWFVSGNFLIDITFTFNILTLLMAFVISFVSFLVHVYSYFYISKEDNLARFQAYLSLFTFSMILLVTSGNLLQMFIGWEMISFCSYLLIVFWYKKPIPNYAAVKAFLVNRFADIAFILGVFVTFSLFGSLNFEEISVGIYENAGASYEFMGITFSLINLITFLFVIAAFAKSAQIGFHIWLPDAMEAPTPVSALLHAATMVTAGIFLVVKLSPLYAYSEFSSSIILVVAAITALYGSVVACMQDDIKKIIAYSTVSQLGYMFLSVGVGFYNLAMFHLFTHAFFKALLFLSAGSVIHGVNGEQNIKNMGNLWRKMPITYIAMWIGSASLIGIPGFAGFYSKEAILTVLQNSNNPYAYMSFILAIITIFFTAFYSFRLIIRVFHGTSKSEVHAHESSFGILSILIILSVLSVFAGKLVINDFIGSNALIFWKNSFFINESSIVEEFSHSIEIYSLSLIGLAFVCIYVIYIREKNFSNKLIKTFPISYKIISNKFYFDYVYDNVISKAVSYVATKLVIIDDNIVDKYLVNTVPSIFYRISRSIYKTQNGSINFYGLVMVFGVLVILTYCFMIF